MTNTQILLKDIIQQEYDEDSNGYNNIESFFEYFSAKTVLKQYTLTDEEIQQGIKGAGNDGGCDSIYIFCNGILIKEDFLQDRTIQKESTLEMIIIQSKTSMKFDENVIMKWKTVSNNLFDLDKKIDTFSNRYNEDIREAFQLFRDVYKALIRKRIKLKIRYCYISEGNQVHPNVKEQGKELEKEVSALFPIAKISVDYYNAERLMECLNQSEKEDYELQLADSPISIGKSNDYVALVTLKEYYNFITGGSDFLDQSIFEANIRDYQGDVSVNTQIRNTLEQKTSQKNIDFWWLNNGITILAKKVMPQTGKSLLVIEPEIVNGLQTSNEIYNYFSENPDKISKDTRNILVRIIVPDNEQLRDDIILATNNQTQIPKSSLRVSDPIHWQIEMYFKSKGLYYDRRKNHYKNLGKKSTEIISVSYLAQALIAVLLQKPNYSRARPSSLLTNDEYYNDLYKREIDLNVYYKIAVWANRIKFYLRHCGLYDTSQQGDLLFYILYYSCAKEIGKTIIEIKDVEDMDIDFLTEQDIELNSSHVFELYISLGGTGKVAKSSIIIDCLMNELEI